MKIVIQISQQIKKFSGFTTPVATLFEIEPLVLYRPSFEHFKAAVLQILKTTKKLIPLNELLLYNTYIPTFQINMEYSQRDKEIKNFQYETPLLSLYTIDEKKLTETIRDLYFTISKDWLIEFEKEKQKRNNKK